MARIRRTTDWNERRKSYRIKTFEVVDGIPESVIWWTPAKVHGYCYDDPYFCIEGVRSDEDGEEMSCHYAIDLEACPKWNAKDEGERLQMRKLAMYCDAVFLSEGKQVNRGEEFADYLGNADFEEDEEYWRIR